MPIGASAGTLDIENATLRSNAIAVLTNMVAGNDQVRQSGPPALEVYGDPSHGGNEPRLELVSNITDTVSNSFTRLTSNAGVFSIETGTSGTSDNGTITFGGFSNERLRITSDGKVGVGTDNPDTKLNVKSGVFLAENQASTNNTILYYDGGGSGGNDNNQYHLSDSKFGTGIFVNDTGTTGSTITLMNKESADNTTKHASIGFVLSDTVFNGKFGGQIGFWPEDNNAVKQQFRIYTSGTSAGYNLPVQQMVVTGDGNVGIGTTNPVDKFHLYGSPIIQHSSIDFTGSDNSWHIVGTWDATGPEVIQKGGTLHLTFLGGQLFGSNPAGKSEILAKVGNGSAHRSIFWKVEGEKIFTDVRMRRVSTNDYKYDICVKMRHYTNHTMRTECSRTTSFERKFTSTTEPSSTDTTNVELGIILPSTDTNGSLGIGTTDPKAPLHVNQNKAIINKQMSLQTLNVYKNAGGNSGTQTRRYYRVYVPNSYANFIIIFQGFARNYSGGGDVQAWRRQYTIQRNFGAIIGITHNSGEDINATGFTFATDQSGSATTVIEAHFDVTFPNKPEGSTYITFTAQVIGDTGYFAENTSV